MLFTANDAYTREYRVLVPADCVESQADADYQHAMRLMERSVKADLTPSTKLDLDALERSPG